MKAIRIMSVVLFVLALAAFIVYTVYDRKTSDYSAPVISADSNSIVASVNVTDEELLSGMKATDNLDGDVTDTLVVASFSKFVKKNTRTVTYAAFDKNNNVGTYTRELTYTDYQPPHFVLQSPLRFHQNESYDNLELSAMVGAEDLLDGNISSQIIVTRGDRYTIDEDTECQPINLQVSNRAGDTASIELDVLYLSYSAFNRQSPNLNEYIIYTKIGVTPDYRANIKGVRSGTSTLPLEDTYYNLYYNFYIDSSEVDIETPGVYKIRYRLVSDEAGIRQELGNAVLILVVEEE